jgi:hypothetical protein
MFIRKFKIFEKKEDMITQIKKIWDEIVKEQFKIIELDDNDLKLEEIISNPDIETRPGFMFLRHDEEFLFHKGEWILDQYAIRHMAKLWTEED